MLPSWFCCTHTHTHTGTHSCKNTLAAAYFSCLQRRCHFLAFFRHFFSPAVPLYLFFSSYFYYYFFCGTGVLLVVVFLLIFAVRVLWLFAFGQRTFRCASESSLGSAVRSLGLFIVVIVMIIAMMIMVLCALNVPQAAPVFWFLCMFYKESCINAGHLRC